MCHLKRSTLRVHFVNVITQGRAVVMERAEGKKAQEETSFIRNRPRGRVKLETSFSKMNGQTSLTDDKAGAHCTRLQPALLYMSCVKADMLP